MNHSWRAPSVLALALVVPLAANYAPVVVAQAARIQASKGSDLRAAFANAADVADGKRIAETMCSGCHGATGVSSMTAVPNLAGQRPVYLYVELRA